MKQTYGSLTLEVPDDFEDETIIILRAPPKASAAPLRVSRGPIARATFVVKRVPLQGDPLPLERLARAEAEMLSASIPGVSVSEHEVRAIGGREAILFEVGFTGPEGPMRQAHVSMLMGRSFVGFVATAPDDLAFASIRERLLELAAPAAVSS